MNAREMFKELRYECFTNGLQHPRKFIKYVRKEIKYWMDNEIEFDLNLRLVSVKNKLEPEEIEAMYQQIKELNWLDE